MAALLNSLFFAFTNSFLPKYRVKYYDYIIKWCSGISCNWCVLMDIDKSLALMLAIKHRHDDHSRLSSSGNIFFDVWHNLPFKKEGLLCCFLEWKRLWARQVGSPTPFIRQ